MFLRTTWAESEMLGRSNHVTDCQDEGCPYEEGDCEGCIAIAALEDEDSLDDSDEDDSDEEIEDGEEN